MRKNEKELNKKYDDAKNRAETGEGIDRIVLDKGDNYIAIVDADFKENYICFLQDTEGNDRRVQMGKDKAKNRERYPEIFDTVDPGQQHHYYYKAIVGKKSKKLGKIEFNRKVRLLEVGVKIFNQVAAIQTDDE